MPLNWNRWGLNMEAVVVVEVAWTMVVHRQPQETVSHLLRENRQNSVTGLLQVQQV
jgi:hypothetical protein